MYHDNPKAFNINLKNTNKYSIPLNTKCQIYKKPFTKKYLSRFHTGCQTNMGGDTGRLWMLILQMHFVVKVDNRLHYVSLTSSVKRAHKRKEG